MLEILLNKIVADDVLHSKWLNTLSFMENAGARKISSSEHPVRTDLMILKHAAEEHRHAYFLKKQIAKLDTGACKTYTPQELLASVQTRHYLHELDIKVCKYLKKHFGNDIDIRFAAYLFVTYAIEVRADELYPVYQQVLDEHKSKVNVKSIILEEAGHLEEMISQLKAFNANWEQHAANIIELESQIFNQWIAALESLILRETSAA